MHLLVNELHKYQNARYNNKDHNAIFTLNLALSKIEQQTLSALFRQYITHVSVHVWTDVLSPTPRHFK